MTTTTGTTAMPTLATPRFTLSHADVRAMSDEGIGFCTSCGQDREMTEPDALGDPCSACGVAAVIGADILPFHSSVAVS